MSRIFLITLLTLWLMPLLYAQPGRCLRFTGPGQGVSVPHSASLELSVFGQMTMEAWVKPSVHAPGERIVLQKSDSSWGLYLLDGLPAFRVADTGMHQALSPHPLDTGHWHHLAGTFDGNTLCLWVDGIPVATSSAEYIRNAVNLPLELGGVSTDPQAGFQGFLDEVRVWRRALGAEELRRNIHRPLPLNPVPPGLSACYSLDADSGSLLADGSGQHNDGLLWGLDTSGGPGSAWSPSTAPLPFHTLRAGDLAQDSVWPGEQGRPLHPWSRVRLDHRMDLYGADSLLSVLVSLDAEIEIHPQAGLTVSEAMQSLPGQDGIILRSGPSGTGSLIEYSSAVPATILKYLTADTWHHFSTPVSTALSGVFTGLWLLPYNEPGGGWGNYITSSGNLLQPTRGYATWSSSATTGNHTLFIFGLMNAGQVNTALLTRSAADPRYRGFNFIGNPYPSGIDWEAREGWTRQGIRSALYVYDPQQQNYRTFVNGSGVNGGSAFIPPMQGFFVRVDPGVSQGQVTFRDAVRVHAPAGNVSNPGFPGFCLRVSHDSSGFYDEARMNFDGEWNPGYDPLRDASKLFSGSANVPQLWTLAPDSLETPMAVNDLGSFLDSLAVPLALDAAAPGGHSLQLQACTGLGNSARIWLEDLFTHSFTDLRSTPSYAFSSAAGDSTVRFLLHLDPTGFSGRVAYHHPLLPPLPSARVRVVGPGGDTLVLNTVAD
ncbi:MAG TPA: LamG domain-containing protein, partial [Bacteroidales bacterium]|nr:LamG domain-containing protein [Bacteroidales bacterium]